MTELADWITAIGTVLAAIASAVAAAYSAKATRGWRDGLKAQRADEFVIALENCAAAIGRTISRKRNFGNNQPNNPHYDLGLDDAWASWARTQAAFKVAKRYFPRLNDTFLKSGDKVLHDLGHFCGQQFNQAVGTKINQDFGDASQISRSQLI